MSLNKGCGPGDRSHVTDYIERATQKLEAEIQKNGIPDDDREAQMACRLAFSIAPGRSRCRQLVLRHGWIRQMDEEVACRMLGIKSPSAKGKVVMAIMRDLMPRLETLREADTAALFCVQSTVVTCESIAPRPLLS